MMVARPVAPDFEKGEPKVKADLKCSCKSSKSDVSDSSESSPMNTPATDDSRSISEKTAPELSTEEKIADLCRERRALLATSGEDRYELDAAFVRTNETYTIFFGMDYTNPWKSRAKQAWEVASRKYSELKLEKEKKRLRLHRIGLDLIALKGESPGFLSRSRAFPPI